MAFASMHEGIFQCEGCGRLYPEYINGCLDEHNGSRHVALIVEEPLTTPVQPDSRPER